MTSELDISNEAVLYSLDERGVATVTLNRPEKHNAFDDQLIVTLTNVFNHIGANPDARVMVLQANGKSFCAGRE